MTTLTDKTYCVVGGAGFIGSNLAAYLLEQGATVRIVDNLSGGKREQVPEGAVFHELDITHPGVLDEVFKGVDGVFHLAAVPRVQYSIEHPLETHEHNVTGTVRVLDAAKRAGVARVVYSASSSAYGDQDTLPLEEQMQAAPKSPYGLQKYIGEMYCKIWSEIYGLETVSLRYFNVYGPNFDPEGPYALVIGKFLQQRKDDKPMTITGDGKQTRDFTHVRDVIDANVRAMTKEGIGHGEVCNVGRGDNYSINTLAELIGGPTEYIPARLEPKDTLADNSYAKELLGWEPTIDLPDGVAELKAAWDLD